MRRPNLSLLEAEKSVDKGFVSLLKCEWNGAPCCASEVSDGDVHDKEERSRPTMRHPPHKFEPCQVKRQEAAKPCQIGKIVCFLHPKMLPFKNFRGSAPNPAGGLNAPQTPTCKTPPFTTAYAPALFLLALTLKMKEFFETSDYRSEHFSTVPFLSKKKQNQASYCVNQIARFTSQG